MLWKRSPARRTSTVVACVVMPTSTPAHLPHSDFADPVVARDRSGRAPSDHPLGKVAAGGGGGTYKGRGSGLEPHDVQYFNQLGLEQGLASTKASELYGAQMNTYEETDKKESAGGGYEGGKPVAGGLD